MRWDMSVCMCVRGGVSCHSEALSAPSGMPEGGVGPERGS